MADIKNVAVIMSFGGADELLQRRSILQFLRVKHIIEKLVRVERVAGMPETRVEFAVTRAEFEVGEIPNKAKARIYGADVVVAILAERNLNVIYELAFRFELKGQCIILVNGDADELLPIYVRNQAYYDLDANVPDSFRRRLNAIAEDKEPHLDFRDPVPDAVAKLIEQHDTNLKFFLENALEAIEEGTDGLPGSSDLVQELDVGHNLAPWTAYYPYSVLRARWKRRSRAFGYSPEDLFQDGLIVYAANQSFCDMFGLSMIAGSIRPTDRLTTRKLLDNLNELGCVDPEQLQKLEEDQNRLLRSILFNASFARAEVPLVFNDKHPRREFRSAAYLPTLVAMRATGVPELREDRPHYSYLIVVFLEQPVPEVI